MSDLYAINLHLQERLEGGWRDEVRAAEAAVWLDDAGLLRNDENGLPLQKLLRAGRIAGQEQRPNEENGSWWIRRLAESPRPGRRFRRARQRMRRYLPIDRSVLHADWPLSGDGTMVVGGTWQDRRGLRLPGARADVSTCYSLTAPPANPSDLTSEQVPAYLKWYAEVEKFRADAMYDLTERFGKLLKEDGRVPHAVRAGLRERLDELRRWRNALCHGAWFGFSGDGAGVLSHYYREDKRIARFPPMVTEQMLADLRARIVDATLRVAEASSVAGSHAALAVVLRREHEPRNREPERG